MSESYVTDDNKNESHKIYAVEFKLFRKFNSECNGADMMLKAIFDSLTESDVPKSLFEMYYDGAYGSDKAIKKRMRNRMYYIGKKIR